MKRSKQILKKMLSELDKNDTSGNGNFPRDENDSDSDFDAKSPENKIPKTAIETERLDKRLDNVTENIDSSITPVQLENDNTCIDDIQYSFKDVKAAEYFIDQYQISNNCKFSVYKTESGFNQKDVDIKNHTILFEDYKRKDAVYQIPFLGHPFVVLGKKRMDCTHGEDRALSTKKKYLEKKKIQSTSDHNFTKSRYHAQNTKKVGCPAKITLRSVVFFTDYKANENTVYKKRKASNNLKNDWKKNPETVKAEKRILVNIMDKHSGHLTNQYSGLSQQIDKRLVKKIDELVGESVRDVREMQRSLNYFVKKEIFPHDTPPPKTSRRFFPELRDIRNHMNISAMKYRHSKIDQENLVIKIKDWESKQDDHLFFRPFRGGKPQEKKEQMFFNEQGDFIGEVYHNGGTRLLFVHQTSFQKRLLKRYGNSICLLDATYKTTKYSLPLFFLAVKTNVDYQVVASFITQDENTETITEALSQIKTWNPEMNPKFFMVDNCEEEISSIGTVFPQTRVLLCDFHREQAWGRWLSASKNGMRENRSEALGFLRKIALSEDHEKYKDNVKNLKDSELWNRKDLGNFRNWIENTWLRVYQLWVRAFRDGILEVPVHTNNGVETKNKDLKHQYLKQYSDKSLSGIVTVLLEQFFPEKQKSYCNTNAKSTNLYRTYQQDIKDWKIDNRPPKFVKHIVERIENAQDITAEMVSKTNESTFKVQQSSKMSPILCYDVVFGDEQTLPYCSCLDWKRNLIPCKHMLAIFRHHKDVSFNSLGERYTTSPFFNIDYEEIGLKKGEQSTFKPAKCLEEEPANSLEEEPADNLEKPHESFEEKVKLDDISKKKFPKRTKANKCRELLKDIKEYTYLVHDEDAFDSLSLQLIDALEFIRSHATIDEGLVLETKTSKIKLPVRSKPKFEQLPNKKKKQTHSGRVGVGVEERRKTIDVADTINKKINLQEEVITIDDDIYDEPYQAAPPPPPPSTPPPPSPLSPPPPSPLSPPPQSSSEEESESETKKVFVRPTINTKEFAVFPKIVQSLYDIDCQAKLVENGCHSLSYLDILSLEPVMTWTDKNTIKKVDKDFEVGWLTDELVNSFFSNLVAKSENTLYVSSTVALSISYGHSFRRMWKGTPLSKKNMVLVPFNPSSSHWILILLNLSTSTITILDPLRIKLAPHSPSVRTSKIVGERIMALKFGIEKPHIELNAPHAIQKDGFNCGVFVCFFGQQLVNGQSICNAFDATQFRGEIYKCVAGNCLKNLDIEKKDECKECKTEDDEKKSWVQCNRCYQWYHCYCRNVELETLADEYYC